MKEKIDHKRGAKGSFIESSALDKKHISVRLQKELKEQFLRLADEEGLTPTELAREVLHEYVRNRSRENAKESA